MMFAHLHSNMFLLFQSPRSILHELCKDLHSNMFLLFLNSDGTLKAEKITFTFQYVSIIS